MRVDDRAIGVERRYTGAPPEVELVVVRMHGRDAELVLDDGESLVFDAEELRKVLEAPVDLHSGDHCRCGHLQGDHKSNRAFLDLAFGVCLVPGCACREFTREEPEPPKPHLRSVA